MKKDIVLNRENSATRSPDELNNPSSITPQTVKDYSVYDLLAKVFADISRMEEKVMLSTKKVATQESKFLAKIEKQEAKFAELLSRQSNRNIEIIGVFSAILALLIVDTSIIKAAENFKTAIALVIGMTASIAIFATMIHQFFSTTEKKIETPIWISLVVLVLLSFFGFFHEEWFITENVASSDLEKTIQITTPIATSSIQ